MKLTNRADIMYLVNSNSLLQMNCLGQYHYQYVSIGLNNRLTTTDNIFCSVDQIQGLQARRVTAA